MDIKITKVDPNVLTIDIPEIEVGHYYICRKCDEENENEFYKRATAYAYELIRRHEIGEPYAIGYRHVPQDDHLHLVIRKTEDDGKRLFEKILGINEDYVEIAQ